MAGLQLSGLASGLDTQSIIDQLMAVEKLPRTRIEMRQAVEQARRDGLNQVQTQLQTLRSAANDLRSIGTWADTQTATSSDTTKLSVTRTGGAGPGGYDVAITRLASSTQRTYAYTPPAADTELTFTVKDSSGTDVPTSIAIAAGASIDDAVSAINTASGSPVYAVNVSGKLVLTSRGTGENARFTMDDSVGGTLAQQSERLGQNAQFSIDGTDFTSQSNTVTDALPGVTLTLSGTTGTSGPVSVNVSVPGPDTSALADKVKAFVSAYNTVVDSIRSKITEKPDPTASTASAAKTGALYADSGLTSVLNQLRRGMSDIIPGNASTLDEMSELGVSTGAASATINSDAVAGKLTFDADKLTSALATDPLSVRRLLGGIAGTDGFAQRITGILDPVSGTDGTLAQRISGGDSTLKGIAQDLTDFDARMALRQANLQKQYTALETALQQAQTRASGISGLTSSSSS